MLSLKATLNTLTGAGAIVVTPPTNLNISLNNTGEYGTSGGSWNVIFPIGTTREYVVVNGTVVRDVTGQAPLTVATQRSGMWNNGNRYCPGSANVNGTATNEGGSISATSNTINVQWNGPNVSCSSGCWDGGSFDYTWEISDPGQTPCGNNTVTSVTTPYGSPSGTQRRSNAFTVSATTNRGASNSASCGPGDPCPPPPDPGPPPPDPWGGWRLTGFTNIDIRCPGGQNNCNAFVTFNSNGIVSGTTARGANFPDWSTGDPPFGTTYTFSGQGSPSVGSQFDFSLGCTGALCGDSSRVFNISAHYNGHTQSASYGWMR